MQLGSDVQIPDGLLAEIALLKAVSINKGINLFTALKGG